MLMRLFAALDLPEEVVESAAAWWSAACIHLPAGQWRDVPESNWHTTLAFYGDVDGDCVDDLAEALADCAARAPRLHLQFRGFGVFPNWSRPSAFWLGVDEEGEPGALRELARCCRRAGRATVRKRGAKDTPFHGHVTLARRRGFPEPLASDTLAHMPDAPEANWQAGLLRLYRSELHPSGARYRVLEEFELAPGAAEREEYVG